MKQLTKETYFCVSISHVEISCNKLLMSVNFGMFAYLVDHVFITLSDIFSGTPDMSINLVQVELK